MFETISGLVLALGAGALSFLSPCVLPIFPGFMSYVSGVSLYALDEKRHRKVMMTHAFFFILGVSLVFMSLGMGATFLGNVIKGLFVGNTGLLIQRITGIFIVIMGLSLGGWIVVPWLLMEKRVQYKKEGISYLGTFLVGLGFAAGWTPCIGPIFGSILLLASTNPSQGIFMTLFYVIGFALPFLFLTLFIGKVKVITKYSGVLVKVGAVILIVMGIVLFMGWMPIISNFILDLIEGTWLSRLG